MPSTTDHSPAFLDAAAYLSNASSLSKVSNDIKLELYGLYKTLTVAARPPTGRPSIFDFAGRAKWDAWQSAGSKYADDNTAAEARYVQIARELGWIEGTPLTHGEGEESDDEGEPTAEELLAQDFDEDAAVDDSGMGAVVSRIEKIEEGAEGLSLHALVVSGEGERLLDFMASHPNAEVDGRDEYGYTPLHLAADRGNIEAVKVLLSKGANKDLKDPDDFTALELAEVSGHDSVVALLRN